MNFKEVLLYSKRAFLIGNLLHTLAKTKLAYSRACVLISGTIENTSIKGLTATIQVRTLAFKTWSRFSSTPIF